MAGADKADGANGVGGEVFAKAAVEGEERRLHGLHEKAVVTAGGGEDLVQLAAVKGSGFFAEDVFASGEGGEAEICVGVGVSGDVDSIDAGGEQSVQAGGDGRH